MREEEEEEEEGIDADIGEPYNKIRVGDILKVAILLPFGDNDPVTLLRDNPGYNLATHKDIKGSQIGFPVTKDNYEYYTTKPGSIRDI